MAATGKVIGTVTAVVGEVKATAADGTVRILQVGDQVYSDEVINTSALGSINVALENGKTLDCGANTDLALHESILGVATAASPATSAPGTPGSDVAALQAAIAGGQDPSQVAPATAAGGAPAAGGVGDGGGGTPVILEQANTSSVVTSGFPTAGDTIAFGAPVFELLPIVPTATPPVVMVEVVLRVEPTTPEQGGTTPTHPGQISAGSVPIIEGTDGDETRSVDFLVTLDQASDQPVIVTYQIVSGPAEAAVGIDAAQTPSDYNGQLSGVLTFAPGETSKIVTVQIVQDHVVENNENFSIVLSDAVNATIDPEHSSAIVTILDDDTAPVAQDDSNTIAEGTASVSATVSGVLANDTDADGDTLSVIALRTGAESGSGTAGAVGSVLQGDFGMLVVNANGSYTYTLNNGNAAVQALDTGESLIDRFTYTASDGFNQPDAATLTITITGTNDVPEITVKTSGEIFASGAEATVFEAGLPAGSAAATASEFTTGSFKVADTDGLDDIKSITINGKPVSIGSLVGATFDGAAGVMTVDSYSSGIANFTYQLTKAVTHVANAAEPDVFTLTVSDGTDTSAPAKVTITIINDVPTAIDDGTSVAEDTAVTVNVLANDIGGADVGKTLLSVSLATQGAGTLSFNANGEVTFTPAAGFEGPATINYTMRDADGDQSSAKLVVTVGPDSVPQITAAADSMVDETGGLDAVSAALTASFGADVPGTIALSAAGATWNATTHTLSASDGSWKAVDNGNGTYTFTQLAAMSHPDASNPDDAILITITAKATDSEGDFTTKDFIVTVKDDGPVFTSADHGVVANTAQTSVVGNLVMSVGADEPGSFALATGQNFPTLTSGGQPVSYSVSGNTLTGYLETNQQNGFQSGEGGDIPVFTLTVNTNATYTFTLLQELELPEIAPIGGSAAYGAGPQFARTLSETSTSEPLALISGWNTVTSGSNAFNAANWFNSGIAVNSNQVAAGEINGSTDGWGVSNNIFNAGEFIRLDFGGQESAWPYAASTFNGPSVSVATVAFTNFSSTDIVKWVAYSSDGVTLDHGQVAFPSGSNVSATVQIPSPTNTASIDYVEFYVQSGSGKLDLVSVSTQTNTGTADLPFKLDITDADGDTASNTFSVTVDGSKSVLDGTSGNDSIAGDATGQTLHGLGGNDILVGGGGHDILTGGAGSDTFKFTGTLDANSSDTVTDFNVAQVTSGGDVLDLHDVLPGAAQGQTTVGGLGAYISVQTVGSNTVVSVDADGAGGAAPVAVVTLEGITGVTLAILLSNSQIHT